MLVSVCDFSCEKVSLVNIFISADQSGLTGLTVESSASGKQIEVCVKMIMNDFDGDLPQCTPSMLPLLYVSLTTIQMMFY